MQIIKIFFHKLYCFMLICKLFIVNTLYSNKKLHLGVPQWNCRSNLLPFLIFKTFYCLHIVLSWILLQFFATHWQKLSVKTQIVVFWNVLIYFFIWATVLICNDLRKKLVYLLEMKMFRDYTSIHFSVRFMIVRTRFNITICLM